MSDRRRARLTADLVRLAEGERAAFDPVFEAAWPIIRRFAHRALKNPADAEDCAQHVLLRVFSRAGEFDPNRDALAWIFGIAAFEVRTIRKKRVRRREAWGEHDPGIDPGFEAGVVARDLEAALFDVIEDMKIEDRQALLAALGDGERPAISGPTFRKRLERAIARLKQAWRMRHGTE